MGLLGVSVDAGAGPRTEEATRTGLVFALTTGLEDTIVLESAFRHAKAVQESGVLAEVTIVVYGRAIVVFDPDVTVPGDIRTSLEAARSAGVHVVLCETALRRYGIPTEEAPPVGNGGTPGRRRDRPPGGRGRRSPLLLTEPS